MSGTSNVSSCPAAPDIHETRSGSAFGEGRVMVVAAASPSATAAIVAAVAVAVAVKDGEVEEGTAASSAAA